MMKYFVFVEDFLLLLVDEFVLVEDFGQGGAHNDFGKMDTNFQLVALMELLRERKGSQHLQNSFH